MTYFVVTTKLQGALSFVNSRLTVVMVLGILTSMMTVVVSKAKSKAVNVQCQANLKQYGDALHNFTASHGAYPLALNPTQGKFAAEHGTMFYKSLQDEGLGPLPHRFPWKEPSVYLCPSAQRQKLPDRLYGELAMYGYNVFGLDGNKSRPLGLGFRSVAEMLRPVTEAEVQNPSQMIAFGDCVMGWKEVFSDGTWIVGRLSTAAELVGSSERVRKRHSGKLNIVFCDGHVEGSKLNLLFSNESDAALAFWNRDGQAHRERINPP